MGGLPLCMNGGRPPELLQHLNTSTLTFSQPETLTTHAHAHKPVRGITVVPGRGPDVLRPGENASVSPQSRR